MTDYAGWAGNAFLAAGLWLTGKKRPSGFLLSALGNVLWGVEALLMVRWDMIACCVFFVAASLWHWRAWRAAPPPKPDPYPLGDYR